MHSIILGAYFKAFIFLTHKTRSKTKGGNCLLDYIARIVCHNQVNKSSTEFCYPCWRVNQLLEIMKAKNAFKGL